jgi:hypothetical protein
MKSLTKMMRTTQNCSKIKRANQRIPTTKKVFRTTTTTNQRIVIKELPV